MSGNEWALPQGFRLQPPRSKRSAIYLAAEACSAAKLLGDEAAQVLLSPLSPTGKFWKAHGITQNKMAKGPRNPERSRTAEKATKHIAAYWARKCIAKERA